MSTDTDDELARLVGAARRDAPGEDDIAAMSVALGLGAGLAGGGPPSAPPAPAGVPWAYGLLGAGGVVAIATLGWLAVGWLDAGPTSGSSDEIASVAVEPVAIEAAAQRAEPEGVAAAGAVVEETAEPLAGTAVEPLAVLEGSAAEPTTVLDAEGAVVDAEPGEHPGAIEATGAREHGRARARRQASAEPTTTLPPPRESEVALLERARSALRAEPGRALSALEQHARSYPGGTLAEEREVMRAEALAGLGRADEARSVARATLARWPGTAHRRRLSRIVDAE